MIYEFALEPSLVTAWGQLPEGGVFLRQFGLGQPRIVSRYPGVVLQINLTKAV